VGNCAIGLLSSLNLGGATDWNFTWLLGLVYGAATVTQNVGRAHSGPIWAETINLDGGSVLYYDPTWATKAGLPQPVNPLFEVTMQGWYSTEDAG